MRGEVTKTKFLNRYQIFNYLTEKLLNEKIDFVAFVVTPFHVLGVDAFLLELKKRYNKLPRGIIFIYPHPKNGIIVNEEHIKCRKFADIEVVYMIDSKPSKKKLVNINNVCKDGLKIIQGILHVSSRKNNRKKLFVISVMYPYLSIFKIFSNKEIAHLYLPKFIVIDEGVGSYMSKKVWELVSKYDRGLKEKERITFSLLVKDTFKGILTSIAKVIGEIVIKAISSVIEIENRLIFSKYNDTTLIPNFIIIHSYRKVLKFEKDIAHRKFISITKKPIVVLGTQPFVEYNQITEYKFIELIDEIIKVLEEKGFTIILKPHPREAPRKYLRLLSKHEELIVVPSSTLLEDILLSCSPTAIIGFTSTSLITSKLFYGIHSISVIDLLTRLSDDPLLKISAKEFKLRFQNIICFIENIEELKSVIDKLR